MIAFAQVPQGVGYQGVATDAGIELVNQSISIRASVISASPSGTIEWQEIHNTSTDTFGLFNLTIGRGTSTKWNSDKFCRYLMGKCYSLSKDRDGCKWRD